MIQSLSTASPTTKRGTRYRTRVESLPRVRAFAVLYLALDAFKPLKEAHGPVAGDELLGIVAARLSQVVPAKDCVCRQGHDQFACLLDVLPSREQLSHLACTLFDAVAAPCDIGPIKLKVRPSIGIAMGPADGETTSSTPPLLSSMPVPLSRSGKRPSELQITAITSNKPMLASAIQLLEPVTCVSWSSCSGDDRRSTATLRNRVLMR